MRKRYALLLVVAVSLVALELAARVFLAWDDGRRFPTAPLGARHAALVDEILRHGERKYLVFDPDTGWAIHPLHSGDPKSPGDSLYSSNSSGLRGTAEVETTPTPGRLRIACFGDSFTHGDDVREADSWPRRLATASGTLEVLNFGVPGYGPDQSLLRYRKLGRKFKADVALLAVTDENAARLLTGFRPFYTFYFLRQDDLLFPKPRFVAEAGRLVEIRSPVASVADLPKVLDPAFQAEMGRDEFFYRTNAYLNWRVPFFEWSALVRLAKVPLCRRANLAAIQNDAIAHESLSAFQAILAAFAAEATADGARPGIVLLMEQSELRTWRTTANYRSIVRDELVAFLEAKGIPYLETDESFIAATKGKSPEALIPGHYSAEGNAVVAGAVRDWLGAIGYLPK